MYENIKLNLSLSKSLKSSGNSFAGIKISKLDKFSKKMVVCLVNKGIKRLCMLNFNREKVLSIIEGQEKLANDDFFLAKEERNVKRTMNFG